MIKNISFTWLIHYKGCVPRVPPPCKSEKATPLFKSFFFFFPTDYILFSQPLLVFHVLLIQLVAALTDLPLTLLLNFPQCVGVSWGSFPFKMVKNTCEPHECSLNCLNLPDLYFITETLHMVKKVIWTNRKNFNVITNPLLT